MDFVKEIESFKNKNRKKRKIVKKKNRRKTVKSKV